MSDHFLYELACGTIAFGELSDAEKTTCRCHIHNEREAIVRVQCSEWLSDCHDCKWRRWCGNNRILANDQSRRHWLRNNSHKVSVQKRERRSAKDAEWQLKKKVEDMGGTWYNGRV